MPAGFDRCNKNGGKVRTVSGPNKRYGLREGEYVHICVDQDGNVHRGYVKQKQEGEGNGSERRE